MSTPGRSYPKRSRQSAGAVTYSTSRRARRSGGTSGRASTGGSGGVIATETLGVAAQKWTKVYRAPVAPTDEPYFGSSATAKFEIPTWVRVDELTAEEKAAYDVEEKKREEQRAVWRRELAARTAAEEAAKAKEKGGKDDIDAEGGTSDGDDATDDVTNSTGAGEGGDGAERRGTMDTLDTVDTAEAESKTKPAVDGMEGTENFLLTASGHPQEEANETEKTEAPTGAGGEEGDAPNLDAAGTAEAASDPTPTDVVTVPAANSPMAMQQPESPAEGEQMEIAKQAEGGEGAQDVQLQPSGEGGEAKNDLGNAGAPPASEELAVVETAHATTEIGDEEKEDSGGAVTTVQTVAGGGTSQVETADAPMNAATDVVSQAPSLDQKSTGAEMAGVEENTGGAESTGS